MESEQELDGQGVEYRDNEGEDVRQTLSRGSSPRQQTPARKNEKPLKEEATPILSAAKARAMALTAR
jgi:hypothetical protein